MRHRGTLQPPGSRRSRQWPLRAHCPTSLPWPGVETPATQQLFAACDLHIRQWHMSQWLTSAPESRVHPNSRFQVRGVPGFPWPQSLALCARLPPLQDHNAMPIFVKRLGLKALHALIARDPVHKSGAGQETAVLPEPQETLARSLKPGHDCGISDVDHRFGTCNNKNASLGLRPKHARADGKVRK